MTPKEKAKELYNKHSYIIKGLLNYPNGTTKYKAKQCAIICVDEIIKAEPVVYIRVFFNIIETSVQNLEYWQEVKQEIEEL
tara:strand:+ start:218 stop:460 length:243 start_codon:yes stop_codon:yes gene_type:complete